jgi:hypothetical protein
MAHDVVATDMASGRYFSESHRAAHCKIKGRWDVGNGSQQASNGSRVTRLRAGGSRLTRTKKKGKKKGFPNTEKKRLDGQTDTTQRQQQELDTASVLPKRSACPNIQHRHTTYPALLSNAMTTAVRHRIAN